MDTRFDVALFTPTEVADYLSIPRATRSRSIGSASIGRRLSKPAPWLAHG